MAEKINHETLYGALAAAQAEMGRAAKDSVNDHFRKPYADLASVMDACMGALSKHGIAVMQPTGQTDRGEFFVRTILAHASGQTAECVTPLILGKRDMQGLGSAITYARRYGLMSMAGVAPDEDDDGAAAVASASAPAAAAKAPARTPAMCAHVDHNAIGGRQDPARGAAFEREVQNKMAILLDIQRLPELAEFWRCLDREVQRDPRMIAAKDDRKMDLETQLEQNGGMQPHNEENNHG